MKRLLPCIVSAALTLVFAGCCSPPDGKTDKSPKSRFFFAPRASSPPVTGHPQLTPPPHHSTSKDGTVTCVVINDHYNTKWFARRGVGTISYYPWQTTPSFSGRAGSGWRAWFQCDSPGQVVSPYNFIMEPGGTTTITVTFPP